MNNLINKLVTVIILFALSITITAQNNDSKETPNEKTFAGLKFRNIGPALMSGRISDIAIHPDNNNIWYVTAGSGGVWKTVNAGTTWTPLFDKQNVYSIGCVTIDPNNHHTVWVGTGENVGGRHVSYGDGIYRSDDDGATWKNMGLKESHHISKIIVHPHDSKIIWVAAQGPLWSKGGERGLYKSTDGGTTWKKTLGDDEWTGVTDIIIDPRNPDVLYAATWQRGRTIASYMGGGPGSGIYRSFDGGLTWEKLTEGLPKSNMGKIGLAISPQKPDVLYAAIELDRRSGGVYRSDNRGSSWTKQSDVVSGATGPHYYQELYASPNQYDRIYLADVRIQVSEDGGKTFRRMKEEHKHSDNHAIAFRDDDPNYLLVGTDGGIYESFDLAENWRFMANLPLTQFYKLALDDAMPFYNIYGGTQDNGTQGGPSRTDTRSGIQNSDWFMTLFADGHQPATEPGNPNIVYAEWQEGHLNRIDRSTGEIVFIQPQPEAGENYERYNWDAPILVSPHSPTRLYFASQRVWQSDDRGDSWKPISGDLTLNQERINLPIMDQTWSWDSPWDVNAMSNYNTITSLAESPLQEGLIYVGTDDGLLQITENGGDSWSKIEVVKLPNLPATAFVNDIKADLHDVNTVYVVLDNHKYGDLKPYIYKSTNRGRTWQSISGNIPDNTIVWRIVQDHVKPELMFAGTEFGIYTTFDGGKNWVKLDGDVPVISFRDLAIQKRENDLVGASFGRSFFVLDDYSALRHVNLEQLKSEATLFPTRDAWWYFPRPKETFGGKGSQGASYFIAPNPPFGAVFTYYLAEEYSTKKAVRQKKEKALLKDKKEVTFPGWDEVEKERREEPPVIMLTINDSTGAVIRRLEGPAGKGFHRVAWDLHKPSASAINIHDQHVGDSRSSRGGTMVLPGSYSVRIASRINGEITELSEPVNFKVKRMKQGALDGASPKETVAFWDEVDNMRMATSALRIVLNTTIKKVAGMKKALSAINKAPGDLDADIYALNQQLLDVEEKLYGNKSKEEIGEKTAPTVISRLNAASMGVQNSTYGPTPTHIKSLAIAQDEFKNVKKELENIINQEIPILEKQLIDVGAPWIEGQEIPDY
ncbi:MAG: glycosyl hydrolase [Bacteroidetes bacterium]|nr:glycosyl hydrolase [Bacteroidota bacterium]MBL6942807.1 glycosyl hydrolase [Bacteroidales bacterium]